MQDIAPAKTNENLNRGRHVNQWQYLADWSDKLWLNLKIPELHRVLGLLQRLSLQGPKGTETLGAQNLQHQPQSLAPQVSKRMCITDGK